MNRPLVPAVILAWIPLVLILFRTIGPRRASMVAVLGGMLLLPRGAVFLPPQDVPAVNKFTVTGLALVLGILLTDPRAILVARPRWADLPMAVFVTSPLMSAAAHGFSEVGRSADQAWQNLTIWAVPYLIGRLYYSDDDGSRRLSIAVLVAGLLTIPICAFEAVLGPKWYLNGLVYGIPPHEQVAQRLGGWRPEGFLNSGLELSTWMALATVLACWLWLCRADWRLWRLPAWSPPLALGLTTAACRGVYGYTILMIGIPAALFTRALGTRVILVALMLIPPAYMGLRISGTWDGRELRDLARRANKESTVAIRMDAEARHVGEVFNYDPILGFGGRYYDAWSDSWWAMVLRQGGFVGLTSYLAAFLLVPVGLAALRLPLQGGRRPMDPSAWGLAFFVILHAIDALHNTSVLPPVTLLGGALAGAQPRWRR